MFNISDIIESNGKTVKENNMNKKHNIPIGCLVEDIETGIRLFVVYHNRDCDGTPLYCLSHDKDDIIQNKIGFGNDKWIMGYPEYCLKIIK